MGMVFCRGCGKEIHETAPACPLCGALQAGPTQPNSARSVGKLIGWGLVWTCVIWVASLFLVGVFAGLVNPDTAGAASEQLGERLAGPFFLLALLASGVLSYLGMLPGTRRAAA